MKTHYTEQQMSDILCEVVGLTTEEADKLVSVISLMPFVDLKNLHKAIGIISKGA